MFYIQVGLFQAQRSSEGWVLPVLGLLGHFGGIWAKRSQLNGRDTQEVAVSLQLYIWNMRSNLSVKTIWGFSYFNSKVTGELGQFWDAGIKYLTNHE